MNPNLALSPEVSEALQKNKPVVALESTLITHGLPYPTNRETALNMEQSIRDNGAVPATIAIINGTVRVGLSEKESNRWRSRLRGPCANAAAAIFRLRWACARTRQQL